MNVYDDELGSWFSVGLSYVGKALAKVAGGSSGVGGAPNFNGPRPGALSLPMVKPPAAPLGTGLTPFSVTAEVNRMTANAHLLAVNGLHPETAAAVDPIVATPNTVPGALVMQPTDLALLPPPSATGDPTAGGLSLGSGLTSTQKLIGSIAIGAAIGVLLNTRRQPRRTSRSR